MNVLGVLLAAATANTAPAPVLAVIHAYHSALEARSVKQLGAVCDPDLLVLEGTHKNEGWVDYRDNHIGPEMKEWSAFKVLATHITDSVVAGELAYLVTESRYRITSKGKAATVEAAETLVLRRTEGRWRILHIHYSGKRVEP